MEKKIYISTPIYYPNGNLHLGHAYTTNIADIISRYKKLDGFQVYFVTGSDEHGQKIEDKAKEEKEETIEFVTKIIKKFKLLWKELGIDYSHFLRTTDKEHINFVQKTYKRLYEKGFIYKGLYEGLYCKSDESYFTKKELNDGKCPLCGREIINLKEESYFLKISNFKSWISSKLKEGDILWPKNKVNELINNFIVDLKDLSISRNSFKWGINVPGDEEHVIYVWLDALLNYISTLEYSNFAIKNKIFSNEVWKKDSKWEVVQLVGKEITRFHAIYWPIILKMLDLREPKILAHGWLINETGDKMSKSKGETINPLDLIKKYDRDSLRFFILNEIKFGEDGKFSEELLIKSINGILVNKFSNLVMRTNAMILKYFNGIVPKKNKEDDFSREIIQIGENKIKLIKEKFNNYEFNSFLEETINYINSLNLYIDKTEPWKEQDLDKLSTILNNLVTGVWNVTIFLSPILIDSKEKIEIWLNKKIISLDELWNDFGGIKLNKIENLFNRIKKINQ